MCDVMENVMKIVMFCVLYVCVVLCYECDFVFVDCGFVVMV